MGIGLISLFLATVNNAALKEGVPATFQFGVFIFAKMISSGFTGSFGLFISFLLKVLRNTSSNFCTGFFQCTTACLFAVVQFSIYYFISDLVFSVFYFFCCCED